MPVQPVCLLRIPEHVVISPKQDFSSGQSGDKGQILFTLVQVLSKRMVSGEHQGILRLDQAIYLLFYFAFVVPPNASKRLHGFVDLKTQVQIA